MSSIIYELVNKIIAVLLGISSDQKDEIMVSSQLITLASNNTATACDSLPTFYDFSKMIGDRKKDEHRVRTVFGMMLSQVCDWFSQVVRNFPAHCSTWFLNSSTDAHMPVPRCFC